MPPGSRCSACLLGCGASTGVGAAIQTAKVWPGARVAVVGLGRIGLSALQGARIAGAGRLIAVDVAAPELAWAERFGPRTSSWPSTVDAVAAVRELTDGDGVDVAFEATGVPERVAGGRDARLRGDRRGDRRAADPAEVTLAWNGTPNAAYPRKTSLLITDGGDAIPSEDFPEMARWALGRARSRRHGDPRARPRGPRRGVPGDARGEVIRSVVVFPS